MITDSMYANFIEQLKILNNNISKQNEILSSQNDMLGAFLIQATSESKFVKMTPNEIETNVPKYIDTLDKVRNSAGVTDEQFSNNNNSLCINISWCYWLYYHNLIWGGCNMIRDYSAGANTSITITDSKILIPNIRTNKKLNILLNVIKNMKG